MNSTSPIDLKDKVVLVTGAYGLIGKELSYSFLTQGAKVVLADLNESVAISVETKIRSEFPKSQFLCLLLDITKEESCQNAVDKTIQSFGKLDVLINNAAIDAKFDKSGLSKVNQSRFENYPLELLKKSIDVNLIGTVVITQVVCRQMLLQGYGNIINVASTYSMVSPNQSLYDFGEGILNFKPVDYIASKSFIPNFTRYLATFLCKK